MAVHMHDCCTRENQSPVYTCTYADITSHFIAVLLFLTFCVHENLRNDMQLSINNNSRSVGCQPDNNTQQSARLYCLIDHHLFISWENHGMQQALPVVLSTTYTQPYNCVDMTSSVSQFTDINNNNQWKSQ